MAQRTEESTVQEYVALRQSFTARCCYLVGVGVGGVATAALDISVWLVLVATVVAILLICIEAIVRLWFLLRREAT